MTSEELRKEQQRIRREYYPGVYKKILENVTEVLKHGINTLMGDDFPVLWAEQYRQSETYYPKAALESLLDKVKDLEVKNRIKQEQKKWEISRKGENAATVKEVRNWLNGLQTDLTKSLRKDLLNSLDIQGAINCLLFTTFPNEQDRILLTRMVKKYGISWFDYKNTMEKCRDSRNKYVGHDSAEIWEKLNSGDVENFTKNVSSVVDPFRKDDEHTIKKALSEFDKYMRKEKAILLEDVFILSDLEKEWNLEAGSLAGILPDSSLASKISDPPEAIFFTEKNYIYKIYNRLISNRKVVSDSGTCPEGFVSTQRRWMPFNKIKHYIRGKLTSDQLEELAGSFSFIAAEDYLLSENGLNTVAYVLGPILAKTKSRLLVDWATLSHLYMTENSSSDLQLRKQAHAAKIMLYAMHKKGLVCYVGSINRETDSDESLYSLISMNKNDRFCLLTKKNDLAELINSQDTPNCISLTSWRDDAFMVRNSAKARLSLLCRDDNKESMEGAAEQTFADNVHRAPGNTDAAPAVIVEKESAPAIFNRGLHSAGFVVSITSNTLQDANIQTEKASGTTLLEGVLPSASFVMPTTGNTLLDANNQAIRLLEKIGSEGGEGTVYRTDRPGFAAKIYHANKITQSRLEKLAYMCKLPVSRYNICWPTSLLYSESGVFVGFMMIIACDDAIEVGRSVFKLCGETVRKKLLPEWNRLSLAQLCVSISDTFAYLHKNNILMGDVNPRNLLVSVSKPYTVYFVDCDSYQVGNFNCPVGMVEYSSPEYLLRLDSTSGGYAECPRTIDDEKFALASLLFRILMLGQSPFASKNNEDLQQSLRKYSFAYKTKENSGKDVPDGPYALIWNNTPPVVSRLFADVFTGEQKHSAEKWSSAFRTYVKNIEEGKNTDKLLPKKYYDATGDYFVDFKCLACQEEANMPEHVHKRLTENNQPLLCNSCMSTIYPLRNENAEIACDRCGKAFTSTMFDKALQQYGKRCVCDSCKNGGRNRFYR